MYMKLISVKMQKTPPQALLHIPPSMTKWEVREYLTKIYGVSVINVDTANFLGKWKRLYAKRKVISFKRRNFKAAYVKFEKPLDE